MHTGTLLGMCVQTPVLPLDFTRNTKYVKKYFYPPVMCMKTSTAQLCFPNTENTDPLMSRVSRGRCFLNVNGQLHNGELPLKSLVTYTFIV